MKKIGYIDGRRIYFYDDTIIAVSKDGHDERGNGSPTAPFLTIAKAFLDVTATRKAILLSPGIYEETLIWPSINGVQLIGLEKPSTKSYGCIIRPAGTEPARADCLGISVNPGVQTETFEMTIQNILLNYSDGKGLKLDNETPEGVKVGRKINCHLDHVVGEGTGRFLDVVHTDADECIRVYQDGDSFEIEGLIYFAVKNADDRLYCSNVWLNGGVETTADAIISHMRFKDCILKLNGGAGGNAAQLVTIIGCVSENDLAYLAAAATEVPTSTLTNLKLA